MYKKVIEIQQLKMFSNQFTCMLLMIQVTDLSVQSINDSTIQNTESKCIVFMCQYVFQNAVSNFELTL